MTKRQEQKEKRRDEILMTSLDLFVKKGYGSTKIADIVRKANISMGLMFHYFASKEQLFNELLKIGYSVINFNLDIDESPLLVFKNILSDIFYILIKQPNAGKLFVLLGEAFRNEGIPEESKELVSQIDIVARSVPIIQKGQSLGEIRQGNSLALAITFWDAIQGIAERMAVNPEMPMPEIEWILAIIKEPNNIGGETHGQKIDN